MSVRNYLIDSSERNEDAFSLAHPLQSCGYAPSSQVQNHSTYHSLQYIK